ncbi:hypothetical protein LSUB1_G008580, partial [Lachnellula subtilissima]
MPVPEGTTVRHARREDVPTILRMIQELAAYEKESSSVEATLESLNNTIAFAPSPSNPPTAPGDSISPTRPARALLLFTPSGEAAGLALYFYNY